jgi:hypothetical protein
MHLLIKIFFAMLSSAFIVVGFLMLLAPAKYPSLYERFVREAVLRRATTEREKRLAIRMQGFVTIVVGAFFALFIWVVL